MNDKRDKIEITERNIEEKGIPNYLLMLGHDCCHDGDEWIGIYNDDKNLKQAYEKTVEKLNEFKEQDNYYHSLKVKIWEFKPGEERENTSLSLKYMNSLQEISLIDPKKLRCFQRKE